MIEHAPGVWPIYLLMEWIYVIAGVVSAWAILRIMGNERERRVEDIAAQLRAMKRAPKAAEEPVVVCEVNSQAQAKSR